MRSCVGIVFAAMACCLGTMRVSEAQDNLEVLQLRPNFYMIAGAGGNIALQVGDDGVVVVDSGPSSKTEAVLAARISNSLLHLSRRSGHLASQHLKAEKVKARRITCPKRIHSLMR
jgi:hypothetical protein